MMRTDAEHSLRFVPSRVEGVPAVTEVAVFPDRIELQSDGVLRVIRFQSIARWRRHGWLWRPLASVGWTCGHPCVADRDWFHPPSERFFRFYTEPSITIYMTDEPAGTGYAQSIFRQVQDVIALGGYTTFD